MSTTYTLPYEDRFILAHTALVMRYEQRDRFLSDDDVLDIANDWTTDDLDFANLDAVCEASDATDWQALTADQEKLVNDLYAHITSEDDQ